MSVLAIDLGTGSVKVALVADDLTVQRHASRSYPVLSPEPGAALGDPALWAQAVEAAVAQVLAERPRRPSEPLHGVGLSGQMHGVVLLDVLGATVGPALLWPDTRAGQELRRLAAGPDALLARLANPLVPGMAGPMLALLSRTEPDRLARASAAVQPKDWLRTAIAGPRALAADPSDASATLLWDVPADRWDVGAAALLGLDPGLLAPVRPSREVAGETTGALGLPAGLPVVTGAGDTACAALGTGTLAPGRGQLSVGTGGQVLVPVDAASVQAGGPPRPVVHTYRDAADGWYRMGAVQNCGLALERVLGWLDADWPQALAALLGSVTRAPVFLPHLSGERTPWLDPSLRGAWVGLGLEHDRSDLLRGALLGVACALADAWDAVVASGAEPGVPLLVGGGSVDGAWRRLLADLLATPLLPAQAPDAAVAGAAALSLVAAGRVGLGEAAALLEARATQGAVPVEPAPTAGAWVDDVRARFADARERLSRP